jgi:hypothetical protein
MTVIWEINKISIDDFLKKRPKVPLQQQNIATSKRDGNVGVERQGSAARTSADDRKIPS